MNPDDLIIGKIYLLKGGSMYRFIGFWSKEKKIVSKYSDNYNLAFSSVTSKDRAPIYSSEPSFVLQRVTRLDASWLRNRRFEEKERSLFGAVEITDFILNEVINE